MEIDVRHIAKLAKLEIPEEEIPKMEKELASIVGMRASKGQGNPATLREMVIAEIEKL